MFIAKNQSFLLFNQVKYAMLEFLRLQQKLNSMIVKK